MIRDVCSSISKAPEANYTEAICDACRSPCPESRLLGKRGIKASKDAEAIAHRNGWTQHRISRRRGRKIETVCELLCPACQAKSEHPKCELCAGHPDSQPHCWTIKYSLPNGYPFARCRHCDATAKVCFECLTRGVIHDRNGNEMDCPKCDGWGVILRDVAKGGSR